MGLPNCWALRIHYLNSKQSGNHSQVTFVSAADINLAKELSSYCGSATLVKGFQVNELQPPPAYFLVQICYFVFKPSCNAAEACIILYVWEIRTRPYTNEEASHSIGQRTPEERKPNVLR